MWQECFCGVGAQGRPEGGSCRTGSGGPGQGLRERAEGTFLTPDEARRSWAFHRPSCWRWRAGPGVWGYSSAWSARDILSQQLAMGLSEEGSGLSSELQGTPL